MIVGVSTQYWEVITKAADEQAFWTSDESHAAARAAILFAFVGTLIWGFGDLLGAVPGLCS